MADDTENPAWCNLSSQAVEVASQAGTSLDEPLRLLDSINHEDSHTFDRPILSQPRIETLNKNLYELHGLPDLHNVDLGTPTDLQIAVSLLFGIFNFCFFLSFLQHDHTSHTCMIFLHVAS